MRDHNLGLVGRAVVILIACLSLATGCSTNGQASEIPPGMKVTPPMTNTQVAQLKAKHNALVARRKLAAATAATAPAAPAAAPTPVGNQDGVNY